MNQSIIAKFPKEIQDFANTFVALQIKRHKADYSPDGKYYKSEVLQDIADAEEAIRKFQRAYLKDRRAFSAFVLFKHRP